jgi:hypothetical protein
MADASATTAHWVEIAGLVLAARGRSELTVRLVAAAVGRRDALSAPRPANEQIEVERAVATAQTSLANQDFETAWREGRQFAIDDAVQIAAINLAKARFTIR